MPKEKHLCYVSELKHRKVEVKAKIKRLEAATKMPQKIDDAFMKLYRELNEARIELATIRSREQHRTSDALVVPVYSIPK
jgi:cyanophycinase-like exopeptidase